MTGPSVPRFERITDYLFLHADRTPDRPFVVFGSDEVTYGEAAQRIQALARALAAAGVGVGDRVATLSTPRPEALFLFLASADIGAIWVGLNPRFHLEEMRYIVRHSAPRVLVTLNRSAERSFDTEVADLAREHSVEHVVTIGQEEGEGSTLAAWEASGAEMPDGPRQAARANSGGQQPALLVYTSGSTGRPKGALLTHFGLCWTYERQWRRWGTDPIRMLCNMPMNHLAGIGEACLTPLVGGGTVVFMERFDAAAVLREIPARGINTLLQIPTMFQLIAAEPTFTPSSLASVEIIIWAGAATPRYLIRRLREFGIRLEEMYGSTEATVSVCCTPPTATIDQLAETVGQPDPELNVRLATADGAPCPPGTTGEIQLRHPAVFAGYLDDAAATAEAFTPDGYLRTGDLAIERPDGYFALVGRAKEMFKSGGYNVYPREIELCIERHPAVATCAVVGVPDELFGEVGHAFVVPHSAQRTLDASEVKAWCSSRLANYKVPKVCYMAEELPRLSVEKIDKRSLREWAARRVAASTGAAGASRAVELPEIRLLAHG